MDARDDDRLLVPDTASESGGVGVWSPTPRPAERRAYALHRGRADPMASAVELGADQFPSALLRAIDCCLTLYPEDRVKNCAKLLELLESQTMSVSNSPNRPVETVLAAFSLRTG